MEETLQMPLNKAQLDLLKLFSRVSDEKELMEIKDLVVEYYANKLNREMDKIWDERGYTQDTMNEWLTHEHKHANRS